MTWKEMAERVTEKEHIRAMEMLLDAKWVSPFMSYPGYFVKLGELSDRHFDYHGNPMKNPFQLEDTNG
jgi:hypothetical protein